MNVSSQGAQIRLKKISLINSLEHVPPQSGCKGIGECFDDLVAPCVALFALCCRCCDPPLDLAITMPVPEDQEMTR